MKYFEKIMEVLKKATVEEIFMVLRFAENVVVGERKTGGAKEETGKIVEREQRGMECRGIHS